MSKPIALIPADLQRLRAMAKVCGPYATPDLEEGIIMLYRLGTEDERDETVREGEKRLQICITHFNTIITVLEEVAVSRDIVLCNNLCEQLLIRIAAELGLDE